MGVVVLEKLRGARDAPNEAGFCTEWPHGPEVIPRMHRIIAALGSNL